MDLMVSVIESVILAFNSSSLGLTNDSWYLQTLSPVDTGFMIIDYSEVSHCYIFTSFKPEYSVNVRLKLTDYF